MKEIFKKLTTAIVWLVFFIPLINVVSIFLLIIFKDAPGTINFIFSIAISGLVAFFVSRFITNSSWKISEIASRPIVNTLNKKISDLEKVQKNNIKYD